MAELTNPVAILQSLIRCQSVTPCEGGALDELQRCCVELGFEVQRPIFKDHDTPDVENLYARKGSNGPHLMFSGHTDVVPAGDEKNWHYPPFEGVLADNVIYGRGAVDMKGGIACFVAALARYMEKGSLAGSVSLAITGDEEGPSINGTVKLVEWAANRGETWQAALVGEPSCRDTLGDMIKIGRRGSLSGIVTIYGKQGHVAYPERASNPMSALSHLLQTLTQQPLDSGNRNFQPSHLEVTSIDTENPATNVIPYNTKARFNVRYNDNWSTETLKAELQARVDAVIKVVNQDRPQHLQFSSDIEWLKSPGGVFLTQNDKLVTTLLGAIKEITGLDAELSTSGGTSDARFIKNYCPVVEFGLVGRTMHMVDECVPVDELEGLTKIYQRFIEVFFTNEN